jgi:hypothetical protein
MAVVSFLLFSGVFWVSSNKLMQSSTTLLYQCVPVICLYTLADIRNKNAHLLLRNDYSPQPPRPLDNFLVEFDGSMKPDRSPAESNVPAELSAQNALKEMPASSRAELQGVSNMYELDGAGRG